MRPAPIRPLITSARCIVFELGRSGSRGRCGQLAQVTARSASAPRDAAARARSLRSIGSPAPRPAIDRLPVRSACQRRAEPSWQPDQLCLSLSLGLGRAPPLLSGPVPVPVPVPVPWPARVDAAAKRTQAERTDAPAESESTYRGRRIGSGRRPARAQYREPFVIKIHSASARERRPNELGGPLLI